MLRPDVLLPILPEPSSLLARTLESGVLGR